MTTANATTTGKLYETQKERWVKYGANVGLTIVVAIALAILVTYLAQRFSRRVDTTASGAYSLKPQTVKLIKDNSSDIKIVSLYTTKEPHDSSMTDQDQLDRIQVVNDLLDEYKRKGSHIDVDWVDPRTNVAKADALIKDITEKYGGEVQKYRGFLEQYPKQRDQIKQLAQAEAAKIKALPLDQVQDATLRRGLDDLGFTIEGFAAYLDKEQEKIDQLLKRKPPDYKLATDRTRTILDLLSQQMAETIRQATEVRDKSSAALPAPIKEYITAAIPRYEEMKKQADAVVKQIDSLGELKLDTLRESLNENDTILVIGKNDLKVIPYDKVWKLDRDQIRGYAMDRDAKLRPRFAGEQQISTAIVALSQAKKAKIVFVRPGGPPQTTPGIPGFQQGGALSAIADRLRDLNFDVLEKDLSGQWAMQAQMSGMPAAPEPSDDEIKDAVWIVLPLPSGSPMQPTAPMASRVQQHLESGGSAMILLFPHGETLAEATRPWGIEGNTEAVLVHEKITPNAGGSRDMYEEARGLPFVFDLRNYGDHDITRPLRSLPSLFAPLLPVKTVPPKAPSTQPTTNPAAAAMATAVASTKATAILPTPTEMQSWAETDISGLERGDDPKFEPEKGDLPAPQFGGAVAERPGGGRLVVIGAPSFVFDGTLRARDPELARRGVLVAAFPGNVELFTNSVYWLSKMDTMIAISPAAMEVPRISDMSEGTLTAWRIGLLLVGLPLLVVVSGLWVYFARQD